MQRGSCGFLTPGIQGEGNSHALGLTTSRAYLSLRPNSMFGVNVRVISHAHPCVHTYSRARFYARRANWYGLG